MDVINFHVQLEKSFKGYNLYIYINSDKLEISEKTASSDINMSVCFLCDAKEYWNHIIPALGGRVKFA